MAELANVQVVKTYTNELGVQTRGLPEAVSAKEFVELIADELPTPEPTPPGAG